MTTTINPKDRFRKGFVLVMTIAITVLFFALIFGFLEALLLAAVFSGVTYPLYRWFQKVLGGRNTLASVMTLVTSVVVILIPLSFLLGLVADQAVEVAEKVTPWVQNQLSGSAEGTNDLWNTIPFADKLAPYRDDILAKLGEFAGKAGGYLASSLAKVSKGTVGFFLTLFVMLYAMFFFFLSGPSLIKTIMSYSPLSQSDKEQMVEVGLSVSRATIKGTLVIGLIQGMLGGLGFAVVGIDAAVFWGAIMAVLSVIPGIGPALVWGPAVIYLLVTGQTVPGLGLLAWSALVVGTVDNVLRPRLVGRDTKMPDLLILLSTLGGLGMFGASGLVLGPILAALFLAVLSIYSRVFADWLNPDQPTEQPSTQ